MSDLLSTNYQSNSSDNNEINLSFFFNIILRNKKLIIIISLLGFIVSCLYAVTKKRIWQGQFQIVVSNEDSKFSSSANFSSRFASIIGLNLKGSSNNLQTQVGILESPSVLMPIFENVNNQKRELNLINDDLLFDNWKKSLSIELKPETSILSIIYKDVDKELIVPVLDQLSQTYQEFSAKNKKGKLENIRKYFNQQIEKYKSKGSKSIRAAQEFAIDQDLSVLNLISKNEFSTGLNLPPMDNPNYVSSLGLSNSSFKLNPGSIDIESVRVAAANEIRNIDAIIRKINNLDPSIDGYEYISLTIPELVTKESSFDVNKIDNSLIELRSKYKDKNQNIEKLIKKRNLLVKSLKKKSINILQAKKLNAEAIVESSSRPKGVVLKYKELMREASRDEETLLALENNLRELNLEIAKIDEPWKLITNPTLKKDPIGPNRRLIALIGTAISFSLAYLIAFMKEKKSELIFEKAILESNFETKILEEYSLEENQFSALSFEIFFRELISANNSKTINFVNLGIADNASISKFKSNLDSKHLNGKNANEKIKFISADIEDLSCISSQQEIIILTSLKYLTFKDMYSFKRRITILNKKIYGIILFY